jgi:hypothetical protein
MLADMLPMLDLEKQKHAQRQDWAKVDELSRMGDRLRSMIADQNRFDPRLPAPQGVERHPMGGLVSPHEDMNITVGGMPEDEYNRQLEEIKRRADRDLFGGGGGEIAGR